MPFYRDRFLIIPISDNYHSGGIESCRKPSNPTMSGSKSSVFKIKNEEVLFQLHHRVKHNNILNVVCEVSEEVAAPFFDEKEKKWIVPNDIVGFESKRPKNVKIRFHPSVVEMSTKNKSVHKAACSTSIEYMDCLLEESEWTRKIDDNNHLEIQIEKLVSLILDLDVLIDFQKNIMTLTFIQDDHYFDELVKLLSCKFISGHIYTNVSDSEDGQVLEINVENENYHKNIARICVDPDYFDISQPNLPLNFEITETCVTFLLCSTIGAMENSPPKVPHHLSMTVISQNTERDVLIYSPCFSMFHLSEKLGSSLQQPSESPAPHQGTLSLSKVGFNLAKDAIIPLDKSESSCLSQFLYNIINEPLVVNCDFDPVPIVSSPKSDPTWSPTDSIDSGVSLSPTRSIDDVYYSPIPRERSCSESAYNCQRLKGILKWPQSYKQSMRFARSYSECHEDGSISPVFMCHSPPFFEDDEDIFQEDDESPIQPPAPRKKSVSFSERIDRRLYNSKTSIEAQKKRTQKKNEKKRNREDSGSNCRGEMEEPELVNMAIRRPTV